MIQIFHGDSATDSRSRLQTALDRERQLGQQIITLDGDRLSPRDLESSLQTKSLFGGTVLVIENLLTRLRSQDKDACLHLLAHYSGNNPLYLWDKKEATKPNLAKLPHAKIFQSKAPTELFTLLDSIVPGNAQSVLALLHQVVSKTEDIIIFSLISRQVSSLLQIQSATAPKLAPWQLSKLRSQALQWTEPQLTHFHDELLKVDLAVKTGQTKLSYLDHLDILLVNLLG